MTRLSVTGPVLACLFLAACDGASWSDMADQVADVRVAPEEPPPLQVEVVDAGGRPVEAAAPTPLPAPAEGPPTASSPSTPAPVRVAEKATRSPSPKNSGGAAVQLGAFRDEAAARAAWARLGANPALQGLQPRFERVERPGASLVRLKAGPLASAEEARAVCARLGVADPWCAKGSFAGRS